MYALPTVIDDHGIHQFDFWSFDSYRDYTPIAKKPLMLVHMYMFNFYFFDKNRIFFNWHMIDSVKFKEPSFFKYV